MLYNRGLIGYVCSLFLFISIGGYFQSEKEARVWHSLHMSPCHDQVLVR